MIMEQFYEQERLKGNTDKITSNDYPDYSLPFYQQIFKLMEAYSNHIRDRGEYICSKCSLRKNDFYCKDDEEYESLRCRSQCKACKGMDVKF